MVKALEGLRIVEVSAFIAAPLAGLQLAQLGADVIRIDPLVPGPGGRGVVAGALDKNRWPVTKDGESLYWAGLNKGKRSILIDTRTAEGQDLAARLITAPGKDGGILLSNLQAKGWLDYEALKKQRGDLIMVHIVGNRDGSVALDYTVNAAAGFPLITGPAGHDGPVNHVVPVWDIVAAHTAVSAMMTAERHRLKTGEGQYARLALSDVAFSALSHLGYVGEAQINETDRARLGNHVYGTFAHDFGTQDSRRVMVTAFTPRHWRALVEATGTAAEIDALARAHGYDFAKEEDRFAAREKIVAVFAPWFAAHTLAAVTTALDRTGACWGPYRTFRQALREDERLSARNPMFAEIDQPGVGRLLSAGAVADFDAWPREPASPAPRFGAHTEEILADDLGLTSGEIAALFDAGIVAGTA